MILISFIIVIAGFCLLGWWMLLIIGALAILYLEWYLPWEEKQEREWHLWLKRQANKERRLKLKFSACHLQMAAYSKKATIKEGNINDTTRI